MLLAGLYVCLRFLVDLILIRQPQAQRDAELLLLRHASEGVRVIRTPLQAPVANCYAERWVESVRRECLNWLIILGRGHLDRVLGEYVDHYNRARPHRALQLQPPNGDAPMPGPVGGINRRVRLGGLIHEYARLPRAA